MSKLTYAILWTGTGSVEDDPMYVTTPEDPNARGYAYCCGCRETLQFKSEDAAHAYMTANGIPPTTHQVTDSATAKAKKTKRLNQCSTPLSSPLPSTPTARKAWSFKP